MEIWIDSDSPEKGKMIGEVEITSTGVGECGYREVATKTESVSGRHAVFFKFKSENPENSICDFESFRFSRQK